jgi:outer membrane porin, OprD family
MKSNMTKRRGLAGYTTATALMLGLAGGLAPAQAQMTAGANPFWTDAKAGYMFRSSYFDRRSSGDNVGTGTLRQQAMGLGGWLYGTTGEVGNTLSLGGTYNFTVPLYAPDDTPFNYILRDPGQDPVSVIGEAYGKLRFGNHAFVIGRQSINQAWYMDDVVRFYNKLDQSMVGRRDVRAMHPLHYEAATVQGRVAQDTVRYYGGYLWNARQINDNDFRNLYQAAFQSTIWPEQNKTGDSSGAAYGGVQWKPSKDMMLEGSYYTFKDMFNMAYLDFDYVYRMPDKNYLRFGTQVMYQDGNGANLVTGGRDFRTHYWGLYGEARLLPWIVPYGMAGLTDEGDEIRSPFSIGPSYLVQRIGENSKAGERTWILGTILDFGPYGARGLSFDINYGQRRNRSNVTAAGATPTTDWDELATDLIYVFQQDSVLKNLRVRARYAKVWENGPPLVGEKTTHDLRLDFGMNIPFK